MYRHEHGPKGPDIVHMLSSAGIYARMLRIAPRSDKEIQDFDDVRKDLIEILTLAAKMAAEI